jgi:hypothetical protein
LLKEWIYEYINELVPWELGKTLFQWSCLCLRHLWKTTRNCLQNQFMSYKKALISFMFSWKNLFVFVLLNKEWGVELSSSFMHQHHRSSLKGWGQCKKTSSQSQRQFEWNEHIASQDDYLKMFWRGNQSHYFILILEFIIVNEYQSLIHERKVN